MIHLLLLESPVFSLSLSSVLFWGRLGGLAQADTFSMFLSVSQLSPFLEATSDGGKGIFGSSAIQGRRLPSLSKTRVREAETCVEIFEGEMRQLKS